MITKLSGASDDIIYHETDGIRDSIGAYKKQYMLFADGSIISGEYDEQGIWRFVPIRPGTARMRLVPFVGKLIDDEYAADECELTGVDVRLIWHSAVVPVEHPKRVQAAKIAAALAKRGCLRDGRADDALRIICEALES